MVFRDMEDDAPILTPVPGEPGVYVDQLGRRYREWSGPVVLDPLGPRPERVEKNTRKPSEQN